MNPRLLLVTVSLVLSVLIGTVLARRGRAPATEVARGARAPLIGLSLDTLKEERWQKDRDRFVAAAEARGAKVLVQSANSDDSRQIQDIESLISNAVDVLVIVPHDGAAMAKGVAAAKKAGIPVISYDRLITGADIDLYLSFDNIKVGEIQARYLVDHLPGKKGRIIRIYGSKTDNNAKLFKQGQDNVLQPLIAAGDVEVVFEDWALDWKLENAKKIVNAAITARGREVDGILASNDGTAGGAVQALIEEGLAGKVLVTGQDAELAACQRIMRGVQTMTVYKPLTRLADLAAEMAVKLARREVVVARETIDNGFKPVPSVLAEIVTVDQANMMDTVVKDGFHSAEALK
jgi:D-xylose transport system substrate-binding protein